MEATVKAIAITEEQIQAIIADVASKLQQIIDQPILDHDELNYYEDEYSHRCHRGSMNLEGELEDICCEGIPGIGEDSDIYISASYKGTCDWHDDYDAGDYWTPPSGGIEIDDVDAYITEMGIEISVYDEDTDEYIQVEVSKEVINCIIEEVNKKVA